MPEAVLDLDRITGWDEFHEECKRVMGFPAFYGANMNAWIDCLSYMTDGGDGMSCFALNGAEVLTIRVLNSRPGSAVQQEILDALIQHTGSVNNRYVAVGDIPRLKLALD